MSSILDEVVDLPPGEREEAAERLCAGDADLRSLVFHFLARWDEARELGRRLGDDDDDDVDEGRPDDAGPEPPDPDRPPEQGRGDAIP